jgi:hypothetical protein
MSGLPNDGLEMDAMRRLVRIAMMPAVRPADLLVEHALSQRTDSWIDAAIGSLAADAGPDEPSPHEWNRTPPTSDGLSAARAGAKRRYERADSTAARCEALLAYAWCVACSMVHQRTTGSSESIDSIHGLLGAAAAVSPIDVRDFLALAIATDCG